MKNYYDILAIDSSSSLEVIKKAFRELSLKWHPDKNKSQNAAEKFKEIVEAYEVLSDPNKRNVYDSECYAYKMSGLLAEAVRKNQYDKILELGRFKLHVDHLYTALRDPESLQLQTFDLLKYILPKNIAMTMIDAYLAASDCPLYGSFTLTSKMYLEKCPGLPSPIEVAAEAGKLELVKFLIQFVEKRPLYIFKGSDRKIYTRMLYSGIEFNSFSIEKFTDYVRRRCKAIENKATIIEVFLNKPTQDLENQIDAIKELDPEIDLRYSLADFFVWSAFHNKSELFQNQFFCRLMPKYPDAMETALYTAAAFNQQAFIFNYPFAINNDIINQILGLAIANKHNAMVTALLKRLHRLVKKDQYSMFAADTLRYAIRFENREMAEHICENGIDPNYILEESTCFNEALLYNIEIAQKMLPLGVEIDKKFGIKGYTALHFACVGKKWTIVKFLVELGANCETINKDGKTPLFGLEVEYQQWILNKCVGDIPLLKTSKKQITDQASAAIQVWGLNAPKRYQMNHTLDSRSEDEEKSANLSI